ncbi:MAG: peptidase S8 family protein, partial [Pseudomonadota bacterium]
NNHLAIFAQSEIQPYAGAKKAFQDCHFYGLPWPRQAIEAIGDETVQLKITLSHFIEPNPGFSATIDPYRYQSCGLRFDLRRLKETELEFAKRVNDKERARRNGPDGKEIKEKIKGVTDSDDWRFGPGSVSAGSLHCDVWTGSAARLLTRNMICVHPIGGWWNSRSKKAVREQKTRYALVMTLKTKDEAIDLHTPIQTLVESDIAIETPF